MRISDALSAVLAKKAGPAKPHALSTVWGEKVKPERVLAEYPRPQLRRDSWVCLNGKWQYAFTRDSSRPKRPDGEILVPFSPESSLSGVNRKLNPGEYLWYRRIVELKEIPQGRRLLLHFGAVDQSCTVWWNGRLAGKSESGYLPFSMDVTEYLRVGENRIHVRVRDDTEGSCRSRGKQSRTPGGMFYTAQSGIWQTVWMEWVPENHIGRMKITPDFDGGTVRLEIWLTAPAETEIRIRWDGDFYAHHIRKREFSPGSGRCVCDFALPGIRAWSPEQPFLYDLEVSAGEDRVSSYFAMRKFSTGLDEKQRPRLFLNNKPYFFNGVLDQGYWPESLYTPPSDEAMQEDVLRMKKLGFNTIRKHVKIEPLRWYYHCDRFGMVVWQDMVNGGAKLWMPFVCYLPNLLPAITGRVPDSLHHLFGRGNRAARKHWERECEQTAELLYNSPCVGMWVLFNEGWGQFDSRRLERRLRVLDSARPIDAASGWYDQGGGDIRSIHNYFRPLQVQHGRRPCVISEYGGIGFSVPGHTYLDKGFSYFDCRDEGEYTERFRKLRRTVEGLESEGLSGAVYTQFSDVEGETNGICTYDRKVLKLR